MATAEAVYRAYLDAEERRDHAGMEAWLSPSVVIEVNGRAVLGSASDDTAAMAALFDAYPDYRREIIDLVGVADRAAVRWRMTGHPRPDLAGRLPELDLRGCSFVVVDHDRICEAYVWSPAAVMDELLALADP